MRCRNSDRGGLVEVVERAKRCVVEGCRCHFAYQERAEEAVGYLELDPVQSIDGRDQKRHVRLGRRNKIWRNGAPRSVWSSVLSRTSWNYVRMALNTESENSYEQYEIENVKVEHNWLAKGSATIELRT